MINTINTRIDTARALPIALSFRHGESVLISIALYNQGQPLKLNEGVAATLFYRTNGLADNQWYKSDDSVGIDNEGNYTIVNLLWTGKLDNGADFYQYAIQLTDGTNHSYAIHGSIALEQSPGFVPNSIQLPVDLLDFAAIEVKNPPYHTKEVIDTELVSIKKDIENLKEDVNGDADESFVAHIKNMDNPHKIKIRQLEKEISSSGNLKVVFDDKGYLSGYFLFDFDPYMFSQGNLNFTLNVGEYAPPPIANRTINYNGKIHLCENWDASSNGYPVFVTESRVGDSVYFYVSVIDLGETTSSARLFFLISGVDNATSMSQVTPFGDAIHTAVSEFEYNQGGMYQIITDRLFRDKITNKAYTLMVENGELKLQEYRITKYEE